MKLATTTEDMEILKEDHIEKVRCLADVGFKYIDLSFYNIDRFNSPFIREGWQDYVKKLQETAESLGVKFVQAHSPKGNPFSTDNFEADLNSTLRSIEVCGILGIENIVVHSGWDLKFGKKEFFERNKEYYEKLYPMMEKTGVNVLVENSSKNMISGWYTLSEGKQMKEFLEFAGHPMLHACWDTGHANMDGHQYKEIVDLGDRLRAVHINDNMGIADQHIAPFMGTVNMDEIICALLDADYKGYFTFEACSVVKNSGNWLQKRREFPQSTRLLEPNLAVHKAMAKFIFEIGKSCLTEYDLYEE